MLARLTTEAVAANPSLEARRAMAQAALDGGTGSNFVIVASKSPLALDELRTHLELVNEPVQLVSGDQLTAFIDDARVLTDDFAPVDQLLAG